MSEYLKNRISDSILEKTESIDELIGLIKTYGFGWDEETKNEVFKQRLAKFKESLSEVLPQFTIEEILKYDKYRHQLNEIYKYADYDNYLTVIEYELRKPKKNRK